MLIFIKFAIIKVPDIEILILLLISFSKNSIFTFFQCEELTLHIDTLFVFDDNNFIICTLPFILEST